MRYGRSRAQELGRLRARFRAVSALEHGGKPATRLAVDLSELRERTCLKLGRLNSCSACAQGHAPPQGRWAGGRCCGARTLGLFSQDEVAALWLAGIRPRDLRPPLTEHAGCAFRGSEGCSLEPRQRPTICVRYLCVEVREEVRQRGDWTTIALLARSMTELFGELCALRSSGATLQA